MADRPKIPSQTGRTQKLPAVSEPGSTPPPAEIAAIWNQVKATHEYIKSLDSRLARVERLEGNIDQLHDDMRELSRSVTRVLNGMHRGSQEDLTTARQLGDLAAAVERRAGQVERRVSDLETQLAVKAATEGSAAGMAAGTEAGTVAGKKASRTWGIGSIVLAFLALLTAAFQYFTAATQKEEKPFKLKPFVNEPSQQQRQD